MRFKATVNNPTGLFKIAQTLDKIGPTVIMTLSRDSVSFIQHREYETGIQAWMKMQPHSLFTNYRLEGTRTGEINLCFRVNALLSISRNAQRATDIQVKLLIKDGRPFISWIMTISDKENEFTHELDVEILYSDRMIYIREPVALATPHTYIMLPDVGELKHRVEKLKSISKFCTLSANMNGTFKITFETSTAEGEAVYEELENPQLEGHESDRDPLEFAYVCIATEDFDSFLSCHHLEPKSIVCAVTDEMQLAFYAYMNIEQYQTLEAPILPINTPQTVLTCHVPVHLE